MWIVFVLLHTFFLALVNYIDEYLTANNKLKQQADIHTRIGGLLLVSTLLTFFGAVFVALIYRETHLATIPLILSIVSAIPMVLVWASYFYLLTMYPVYQVMPLFQLNSLWLLIIELISGVPLSIPGLIGIFALMIGAYVLDAGSLKWKIPTKLLLLMIPVTLFSSIYLYLVRLASGKSSSIAVSLWQLIGVGSIGILLFVFVKKYREGFIFRIRNQGKNFLGFSLLNESLSQSGYVFLNVAVALAPLATYVAALSGLQSVFVLLFFVLFPQKQRSKITVLQIVSILLMAAGVFLIELAG